MAVVNYYTMNGRIRAEETIGGSGLRGYGPDALGSVVATYDSNGLKDNTYHHKPYGGLASKTGTAPDPKFTWVGALGYRQTSLGYADVYLRAGHYATMLGRWISSATPAGETQNAYASCAPASKTGPGAGMGCTCTPASYYNITTEYLDLNLNYLCAGLHVTIETDNLLLCRIYGNCTSKFRFYTHVHLRATMSDICIGIYCGLPFLFFDGTIAKWLTFITGLACEKLFDPREDPYGCVRKIEINPLANLFVVEMSITRVTYGEAVCKETGSCDLDITSECGSARKQKLRGPYPCPIPCVVRPR